MASPSARCRGATGPMSRARRGRRASPAALLPASSRGPSCRAGSGGPRGPSCPPGRAESPRVAVEDRREHARAVHPRQAQPLHVAAGRHQRRRLAVGEKAVLGDRRKRTATTRDPLGTHPPQPLRAPVLTASHAAIIADPAGRRGAGARPSAMAVAGANGRAQEPRLAAPARRVRSRLDRRLCAGCGRVSTGAYDLVRGAERRRPRARPPRLCRRSPTARSLASPPPSYSPSMASSPWSQSAPTATRSASSRLPGAPGRPPPGRPQSESPRPTGAFSFASRGSMRPRPTTGAHAQPLGDRARDWLLDRAGFDDIAWPRTGRSPQQARRQRCRRSAVAQAPQGCFRDRRSSQRGARRWS